MKQTATCGTRKCIILYIKPKKKMVNKIECPMTFVWFWHSKVFVVNNFTKI